MAKITIIIGGLLILLGLLGYFVLQAPDEEGAKSITAMIPAFFGLPIVICGVIALNEGLRKHAMHGAVLLGLLGVLGALGRPASKVMAGEFELNSASSVQLIMAFICLVFEILCIKSFISARKNREDSE